MLDAARPALLAGSILLLPWPGAAQEPRSAAVDADWLDRYADLVARAIEGAGIAIIVVGGVVATAWFLWRLARTGMAAEAYHAYRSHLGRGILLGLEFLVAADIIGTVAIDPTLDSLAVLAGIVLIRTFLSFSLEVEIEGRWPWQRSRRPPVSEASPEPERARG